MTHQNNWLEEFEKDILNQPEPEMGPPAAAPSTWRWLERIDGLPLMLQLGLDEYGTREIAGSRNNKRVVNWAKEVAKCNPNNYSNWAADWYNKDSIPWCGLFIAILACRSMYGKTDRAPVKSYLTALAWSDWAEPVDARNLNNIWCGDLVTFTRNGGGHVAVVVGVSKDGRNIICLGGNQSDAVNIAAFPISRLYAVRRPRYRVRPKGAKHIRISGTVPVSTNEA